MEIHVANNRLRAALEDDTARLRRFGAAMSKKLKMRLDALHAAESLADFWPPNSGPERCHEFTGNRAGVFSIDLRQPHRLLFRPIEAAQTADRSDEQQRWNNIIEIEILEIKDTHG